MAVTATIEQAPSGLAATSPAEQRRTRLEAELQRFLAIVIDQMHPERIILFGSLVTGQVHEWSDLDLVVVAETELPFLERLRVISELLTPRVGTDVFVYTPNEWEHLRQTRLFVQEEMVQKGRVLYERVQ